MAKVKDELINHSYDGIQEYDNDLPGWWKKLFYVSIVFAVIYLFHFHVFKSGDLSEVEYLKSVGAYYGEESQGVFARYTSPYTGSEELDAVLTAAGAGGTGLAELSGSSSFEDVLMVAMELADENQLAALETAFPDIFGQYLAATGASAGAAGGSAPMAAAVVSDPLTDEASLAAGKSVWDVQCFTCHGMAGEGGIGPNMTDNYWIHGGTFPDIIEIINVGVPAKGMIPWRGTLTPDQIHQVASYLVTFQGTDPPNQKAPEGEPVSS